MATFKDNFSKQSDIYLKYRPLYPPELYSFLASLTEQHQLAWDCGTGNGQAAIGLADHYEDVVATDPSERQIRNCIPHEKIKYFIEKVEENFIPSNSIDLITVANALHWFNFDLFYKEVNRTLKPNGIIAVWAYLLPTVSSEIDKIISNYHYKTLNDYWLPENRLIEKEYKTIPFPFQQIDTPDFYCQKQMNLTDLIGYLNTWSGTQRFIAENGFNPTDKLVDEFGKVWQNAEEEKTVAWKLILKVGKKI